MENLNVNHFSPVQTQNQTNAFQCPLASLDPSDRKIFLAVMEKFETTGFKSLSADDIKNFNKIKLKINERLIKNENSANLLFNKINDISVSILNKKEENIKRFLLQANLDNINEENTSGLESNNPGYISLLQAQLYNFNEKHTLSLKKKGMFFSNMQEALEKNPSPQLAVWKDTTQKGYGVIVNGQLPSIVPFNENLKDNIQILQQKSLDNINKKYILSLQQEGMFFPNREKALEKNPSPQLAVWKSSIEQGYRVIVNGKERPIVRFNENLEEKIKLLQQNK